MSLVYASICRLHKLCIHSCMGAQRGMFRASAWVSGVFQWAVEWWVLLLGPSSVCFMLESASNGNLVTRYSLAKSICKVGANGSGGKIDADAVVDQEERSRVDHRRRSWQRSVLMADLERLLSLLWPVKARPGDNWLGLVVIDAITVSVDIGTGLGSALQAIELGLLSKNFRSWLT